MESNDEDLGTISLQVSAQIVKHISSGLYRSPGSALKELISNSFDADASKVEITYDFGYDHTGTIKLSKLIIKDDGRGMDIYDLKKIFTHVGGSDKDSPNREMKTDRYKRPIIGSFGIGMLSVAATCNKFRIITKKKEGQREFIADVSFEFFKDLILRTESMDKVKLGNIDLSSRHTEKEFEQYTIYEISNFEPPFLDGLIPSIGDSYFYKNKRIEDDDEYFKKFVTQKIQSVDMKSTKKLAYLDKMITDVAVMSPIEYLPDGPIRKKVSLNGKDYEIPGTDNKDYNELIERLKKFNFEVRIFLNREGKEINNFKIFKPFLYPTDSDIAEFGFDNLDPKIWVLPKVDNEIVAENEPLHVNLTGYYYHQSKRILPLEFRGTLFRVHNVSLGYDLGDISNIFTDTYLILHQTFSEIYLDNGFQRIVNLDRESLYEGSSVYRFLMNYLKEVINNIGRQKTPPIPVVPTSGKEKLFQESSERVIKEAISKAGVSNIVSQIKKERALKRSANIRRTGSNLTKEILHADENADIKRERTKNVSEMDIKNEGKKIIVTVPNFRKHPELWDNLAVGVLKIVQDKDTKEEMLSFLISLYSEIEGDEIN